MRSHAAWILGGVLNVHPKFSSFSRVLVRCIAQNELNRVTDASVVTRVVERVHSKLHILSFISP